MGLLGQIIGTLGGQEPVERLAREEADFDDPQSPDVAHWHALVGAAPPEAVQDAIARAARRVNPQEYSDHITPAGAPWAPSPAACWGASQGVTAARSTSYRSGCRGCTRPIRSG